MSDQAPIQGTLLRKQVFVAYSYRLYPKDDYRKLYRELEEKYDVTFIFADEKITNMHIMRKIETFIRGPIFYLRYLGLESECDARARFRDGYRRSMVYRNRSIKNRRQRSAY